VAHLDTAPNGAVRGVFGWVKAPGDIIQGRYRVRDMLGRGGFGATYLVEDLRLEGKRRAIKELPELLFDEYEIKLLSQLSHTAVPDIIDRSMEHGMVYLVLEFGGTRTLGSEAKRRGGRVPVAALVPWLRQLCEVLTYLHGRDPPIIHRDLKPDNVLLDDDDRVMLIDFGIAKQAQPTAMTRTLGRAVTHGFGPPEQALGTGTDQRSDIYSLGATVYYLLTGQVPPAAHERVAGKEVVPPSHLAPDIPQVLEATLLRALSLNPNQRQQSIREFAAVLDSVGGLASAAPAPPTSARTVLLGNTGALPPAAGLPSSGAVSRGTAATSAHPWRGVWMAGAVVVAAIAGGYYFAVGSRTSDITPQASGSGSKADVAGPGPVIAPPAAPAAQATTSPPAPTAWPATGLAGPGAGGDVSSTGNVATVPAIAPTSGTPNAAGSPTGQWGQGAPAAPQQVSLPATPSPSPTPGSGGSALEILTGKRAPQQPVTVQPEGPPLPTHIPRVRHSEPPSGRSAHLQHPEPPSDRKAPIIWGQGVRRDERRTD
jgi:serine/threonine-protein kinase